MKVYISGRVSGRPENEVRREFRAAEEKIRRFGLEAVNPIDNGLPASADWEEHMGRDIAMLLRCDAIYMLPGWRDSRGAVLEFGIARYLKKRVFRAETFENHVSYLSQNGRL